MLSHSELKPFIICILCLCSFLHVEYKYNFQSFPTMLLNTKHSFKKQKKNYLSFQGEFEVSMNSFHVCMNSSCACKCFEIAKSSKLIEIFPLQIHILDLFCILPFTERKRSGSRLSFWPQKYLLFQRPFNSKGVTSALALCKLLV